MVDLGTRGVNTCKFPNFRMGDVDLGKLKGMGEVEN